MIFIFVSIVLLVYTIWWCILFLWTIQFWFCCFIFIEIAGFGFEDTPSDSFLSTLPKKLGNCVLPLGIELGLRITDVEAVFVRYPKDLFSQVYEIIRIWKEKTQENTYSNLMLAIQRVRGKQFIERNFCCFNWDLWSHCTEMGMKKYLMKIYLH